MRCWIAMLATITLILTPYLSRGMLALRRGVGHDRVMRIEGYPTDDSSIAEALKRFFPEPKNILRGLLFAALALPPGVKPHPAGKLNRAPAPLAPPC